MISRLFHISQLLHDSVEVILVCDSHHQGLCLLANTVLHVLIIKTLFQLCVKKKKYKSTKFIVQLQ